MKKIIVLSTVLFFVLGIAGSASADVFKTTKPCQPSSCSSGQTVTVCATSCHQDNASFCVGKPPCTIFTSCGSACGVTPPTGGTVNVTSENSVITTQPVSSNWNFAGSVADPCAGSQAQCSGTAKTYDGQPSGAPSDTYILNISAKPAGYSLRSINKSVAQAAPNPKNVLAAFFNNFFTQAHAAVVCGFLNSNASSCPNPISGLALSNTNDTANFIILWDPVANMAPITNPINLTSSTLSKVVPLTNNGSAGSMLTWTAGAPVYSAGASGWLNVSLSNGSVVAGSSDNITFTANPAGLPVGNYSATIIFNGTSAPGTPPSPIPAQTVTVNFSTGAVGSPVKIISVSPSSTVPVATSVTTVCSGGSGAYKWTASGPAIPNSGNGASFTFSYGTFSPVGSPYTVTCIDANNVNSMDSVLITVTQVSPACGFAANPQQIIVPGTSTLSWTCVNAVSCNIGGTPVNPVSGMMNVVPTSDTTYTLSCKGPGTGVGSVSSVQTTVRVVGPVIIETGP